MMEILGGLGQGFTVALQPLNLLWCFVGVFLGTVVGVMPGLGPAATIAMRTPGRTSSSMPRLTRSVRPAK